MRSDRTPLPKYVVEYEVPKGSDKWFVYFRRKGQKDIRMRGTPRTPDWDALYARLLAGEVPDELGDSKPSVAENTFSWICREYMTSSAFAQLDARTQRVRRQILQTCIDEPIKPGSIATFGGVPLPQFTPKAVSVLRDRKKGLPEAANGRVKAIRSVFKWASSPEVGIMHTNPAKDIQKRASNNPDGVHSWSIEDVEKFEAHHAVGTKARLALALLLYTAQRRSDAVLLGRGHERDGWLHLTQQKNRRNKPVTLDIPIRPELRTIIDASPVGEVTYLVNDLGRPFTANGFGNKMREWCDQAGLPECTAHGLRKAAATRLAEAGASAHEIMAITGHKTMKEVERYTRAADQKRLAATASGRRA